MQIKTQCLPGLALIGESNSRGGKGKKSHGDKLLLLLGEGLKRLNCQGRIIGENEPTGGSVFREKMTQGEKKRKVHRRKEGGGDRMNKQGAREKKKANPNFLNKILR